MKALPFRHPRLAIGAFSMLVAGLAWASRHWWSATRPDPEMQQVLDHLAALAPAPLPALDAVAARRQPGPADAVRSMLKSGWHDTAPRTPVSARNIVVQGATGELPARLYVPRTPMTGDLPLILYFHGGGFVIADLDTYDASARALAALTGAMVLSAHYRQAPEHKFPAAHEDAYAIYRWLLENADGFDADPKRIAVAGESAGGNLAMHVSVRARDAGLPMPRHQLLVYPLAGKDMDTASYRRHAHAKPLDKAAMQWFVEQALEDVAQAADPRINLVDAELAGLPPTSVITAEIDPMQSEGLLLAERLTAAGVKTRVRNWRGVTHEFFGMGAVLDQARDAQAWAAWALRAALDLEADVSASSTPG